MPKEYRQWLRAATKHKALTPKQLRRLRSMMMGKVNPTVQDYSLIEWVNLLNLPPKYLKQHLFLQ